MDADSEDVDELGWSNNCRCMPSLLCKCQQPQAFTQQIEKNACSISRAFFHTMHLPPSQLRSQCRGSGKRLLCCEFGLSTDAADDNVRAVCSRALCFTCARVSKAPTGAFICGAHVTETPASTATAAAVVAATAPTPLPPPSAITSAAAIAAAAPHSFNLDSRLVLITCQAPVGLSHLTPHASNITHALPFPPQEECALLLPRKVPPLPLALFRAMQPPP